MRSQFITSCVLHLLLALCISGSSRTLISNILDVAPGSRDFISCLRWHSNNFSSISGNTLTSINASFLPIWQERLFNLMYLDAPRPSVIVTPVDETQVRTVLLCAKKHGYELRIRSGGHDFEALSSTADVPFVMLDLINMRSINVDVAKRTAVVQAGAVLGEVYYAISQQTDTLYFPAGLCPTVGIGGYLSGGGYGNLLRKYGAGADNVIDVRFMDVNGNILDKNSMGKDLWWALRGGVASSFGIVLAWKIRLVPVPPKVTVFDVGKTLAEGATEIFFKYQNVITTMDRNLLIRVQWIVDNGTTANKTIRMAYAGIYQGTIDTLLPLLEENLPELNVTREVCEEVTMAQSSLIFAGFNSSTPTSTLANRAVTSRLYKLNTKGKSDYIREPISIEMLNKLWDKILESNGSATFYLNPWGGRMSDFSETAIPYPHRAGVLFQVLQVVDFTDQPSMTTPTSIARLEWIDSFDEFLVPYVSSNPREAYVNYNDLDLGVGSDTYEEASVWGERYWKRDNFKRLIRVKARVDPDNFFRHPQSIPVFSTPLSDI